MHALKLPVNNIQYPVVEYSSGRNLSISLGTNNIRAFEYALMNSWFLDNQNPLVTFLKNLSLDINQPNEYLYNTIANKRYIIAGLSKITSIYNKGKSFNTVLFPESGHETLLVIPFGKSQYDANYYFTTSIENLRPLTTLYTTDTTIRYSTTRLTSPANDGKRRFTVVQVDPFALAIGYIRYCKERLQVGNDAALTPNFYLSTSPLASFYIQHNNYVIVNLLRQSDFTVDETKWSQVNIKRILTAYIDFQQTTLSRLSLKSVNHYLHQLNALPSEFKTYSNFNPANGFSSSFIQLSWPYSFGPMQLSIAYLNQVTANGLVDDGYKSYLRKFLNYNVNTLTNNIPDTIWVKEYERLFTALKALV